MMQKMRFFGWRSSSAFQKGSPGSTQRQKQHQFLQVMISQQFTLPYLFPFRNWNHVNEVYIKFSEHPNILMELIQFFMEVPISRSPNFFRVSSIF